MAGFVHEEGGATDSNECGSNEASGEEAFY